MTDENCRLCDGHGWLIDVAYPSDCSGPIWQPCERYGTDVDKNKFDFKGRPEVMACPICNKAEE